MASLTISPERSRADRRAFIQVPYELYRKDPIWVPPLRMAERDQMNRAKHPFFEHATVEHFLARRGRRVVGRIAAIENERHNAFHEERIGFFGYFDVEADPEAAKGLLAAAHAWVRARGLGPMRGPTSYSTNEVCGVLVDGFDEPPQLLMAYNRPDYGALIEGAGLRPVKDLLALYAPTSLAGSPRFARIVDRRLQRSNIVLRPINLKRFDEEVATLKALYNRCWERNWGFVPATDAEFDHAAKDMRQILEPHQSAIAEAEGVPVGFSVFLRDLNEVLAKGPRHGRLFPTLWWRLLRGLPRVTRSRCALLGVVPEARGRAITEGLILHGQRAGAAAGIVGCECGWVLEDNEAMLNPIRAVDGRIAKRYRLYQTNEAEAAPG